jgi:PucR family transcriptional regulator, purine catabolism regulatory protein
MATLRDLHRAVFPAARPVGGGELDPARAERDVSWVRVLKARVPAFDALDPGDLAIIPGPALAIVAPGPAQMDELAAALARARVPAVLLAEGEGGSEALDVLGETGERTGLTVLRLARVDPVTLERSVIGFLVNRRAELDRRAAELESQLTRVALDGHGLDGMAATIGEFLGRPVVIEGRRGDPLAIHVPTDQPSAAPAVATYLGRPSSAAMRTPLPAPPGEAGIGGRLVLLGDTPPGELDRVAAERITALLALELARDVAVRQAREEARPGEGLPVDGPPWVVIVARQRDGPGTDDRVAREQVRADLRMLAPGRRLVLRGSPESLEIRLVAATPSDDPGGLAIAERVAGLLGRTVAVSRTFLEPAGRPAAEATARATLEAIELLREPPAVGLASRLPAYRLLGDLHNLPDGSRQARELLAPILGGSEPARRERLTTLRTVLGSSTLGEAAARLGVHRNTVAYRVARLERLGGWDLSDPDLRFALELAARLVQDAQSDVEIRD